MTVEEYLAADQTSERHLEFHDGEVFPRAEASLNHGLLHFNLAASVRPRLKGHCQGSISVRVQVSASQFVYPDILVFCGKAELSSGPDPSLTNPKVIFESLSPARFQIYRQLTSLEEFVFLAQDQPNVEVFRRLPDARWILTIYQGLEATVSLDSLNLQLPMSEIYAQVL